MLLSSNIILICIKVGLNHRTIQLAMCKTYGKTKINEDGRADFAVSLLNTVGYIIIIMLNKFRE